MRQQPKSLVQGVIDQMEKEGRVKTLTFEQSAEIDQAFTREYLQIKKKAERLEKNSRDYIAQIEATHYEC